MGVIDKTGCSFIFKNKKCQIVNSENKIVAVGNSYSIPLDIQLWHRRMGHLNPEYLKQLRDELCHEWHNSWHKISYTFNAT